MSFTLSLPWLIVFSAIATADERLASSFEEINQFIDKNGQHHTPREWFVAPLNIIEDAINLVLNGEIIHCKYDPEIQKIVDR